MNSLKGLDLVWIVLDLSLLLLEILFGWFDLMLAEYLFCLGIIFSIGSLKHFLIEGSLRRFNEVYMTTYLQYIQA